MKELFEKYNADLEFVVKYGDFTQEGRLFALYSDSFHDWYGELSEFDLNGDCGFPEVDFFEWFKSRYLTDDSDLLDPEIEAADIEAEKKKIENMLSCSN